MRITLEISETVAGLLQVLAPEGQQHQPPSASSVAVVIATLIDHAQQGVYRPGAWERGWLTQAFGDEWTEHLEPGDPHGRSGCEHIFQRPRR